ncbi:MAG TPA: SEC-C metal-binding domain-containing protein, partial [Actinomycetes bacterium]|nr:SEC-C metal-binding domain-containing protein [Actinomycetes bacterium]
HEQYAQREKQIGSEAMREFERKVVLSVLDRKWREHLYEMDYLQEGIGLRAMAQRDPLVEYQREGFDLFSSMMDAIKEESVGYLFNLEVQIEQRPAVVAGADGEAGADAAVPAEQDGAERAVPAAAAAAGPGIPVGTSAGPAIVAKGLVAPRRPARLEYSAPTVDGGAAGVERRSGGTAAAAPARSGGTVVEASVAADHPEWGKVARNAPCPCGSGRKFKRCHGSPAR